MTAFTSTQTHSDASPPTLTSMLVVIVNYRTAHLTIECLRSLASEVRALPGTRAVVVDNNSGDDSADRIATAIETNAWDEWVSLVRSPKNGGYAFGNNAGIRPALESAHPPDYFLVLNPDTIVRPGALAALVEFMESHPDAGIAGSAFEKNDGKPWHVTFGFPNICSEFDAGLRLGIVSKLLSKWAVLRQMSDEPEQTDWVPGACFIVRRQVFESVGLMDDGYFLYYEETDFCLRTRRGGWSCWYVPQSLVKHIGGQSTGYTYDENDRPKRLPKYRFESRQRYFVKNHGWWYAAVADRVWLLGFVLWRCRRVLQGKPDTDPPKLLGDFWQNSVFARSSR